MPEELKRMSGDTVKALPLVNGQRRIGGYIVRFTDPNNPDLHGQWFSKDTDFGPGWSIVNKPVLVEHGLDPAFKSMPIGIFDLERVDDIGIYAEAWLFEKQQYEDMLRKRREQKRITWDDSTIQRKAEIAVKAVDTFLSLKPHWSSGALPQAVEVNEETQHIDVWPPIEASTTNQAAEPNGTDVLSTRSVLDEVASLLSLSPDAPHEDGSTGDGQSARKDAPQSEREAAPEPPIQLAKKERKAMTPEEIQAIVQGILDGIKPLLSQAEQGEQMMPAPADVVAAVQPAVDPTLKPEDQAKNYAAVQKAAYDFVMAHVEKKRAGVKAAADSTNAFLKRTLPAIDDLPAGSSGNGSGHSARISGVEDRRFADASAADMALGLLARQASAPKGMNFPVTTFVSNDYLKHMVGKMERELDKNLTFKDERNISAVKSVMPALKANEIDASNNTGFGTEFVSDWWSSTIWEVARANPIYKEVIARGIWEQVIPDGASNGTFPTTGSDPIAYVRNQANSLDATGRPEVTANINRFGTGNVTITPNELALASSFTMIEQEDSIIPIAAQLNKQFSFKMDETIEQALINGDTEPAANTNINLIDGTPGTGLSKPYYLLTDGWLKEALVTHTAYSRSGGAIDENDIRLTVKLMLKTIRNRKDKLVFVVDSDTYNTMLDIVAIKTDEVRNRNSTLTTGNVESVFGYKVLESAFMELANSSGKVTAAIDGTLGRMCLVYPDYWGIAWKRRMTVEQAYDVESGTFVYVASLRMGMKPRGPSASAVSYNLTIA